jgi:hypothetical protein
MPSYTNLIDPDETLDYGLDLTDWLETGATVSSASWTVESGLTEVSESTSSPTSAVMVSVDTAVAGDVKTLKGAVTDSDGRTMVRRIRLYVGER